MRLKRRLLCLGGLTLVGGLLFYQVGETKQITTDQKISAIHCMEMKPVGSDYVIKEKKENEIYQGDLILVNNKVPYQFCNEDSLTSVFEHKTSSYYVKDKNVKIDQRILPNINAMMDEYYKEKNSKVNIISGYRSKQLQSALYNKSAKENGAEHAKDYVANPGYSEHHSGLAIDLGLFNKKTGTSATFTGEGDSSWIRDNAYRYGFVLRYPKEKEELTGIKYESWHFRYVGVPHSYIMTANNFCLEEYIDFIKQYKANKKHLKVKVEGKEYEIYYVKGTKVPVPKDSKDYVISGDNVGGFIVTRAVAPEGE